MEYRMALVGTSDWISAKESARDFVRQQVDMIVADGYNTIMMGPNTFFPMLFIDYTSSPYPEAAQLPPKQVKSNLETLRENIRYAKSQGIKYFITRSYSLYAPYGFWMAHQKELNPDNVFHSYLMKAHQNDKYRKALAVKGGTSVVPHQQWTNETYRDFYVWSMRKVLDLIPELDGFNTAFAEAAWIVDMDKLRAGKSPKECIDMEATEKAFVDFASCNYDIVKSKRGENGIFNLREWYMTEEVLSSLNIPKDDFIITCRYGGFDQPIANYPPWAKDLLDKGYKVVLDFHSYDAEYPKPVYFYDVDLYNDMFSGIREAGFTGVCQLDYVLSGEDRLDNPIRRLTLKHIGVVMRGGRFTGNDARSFLKPYYGKGTDDILRSLHATTVAQENYIKLQPAWFWYGDGLTPGGIKPQPYWMFADNPDAPDRMGFVRQNVVSLGDYVSEAVKGAEALQAACVKWSEEGKLTPVDVIDLMDREADTAIAAILDARRKAPENAPYMQDLVASSFVHKVLVDRNSAYIRSAIDFYMSGYVYNGKYDRERRKVNDTGIDLTADCLREWQKFFEAQMLLGRLTAEYSPRRRGLSDKTDFPFPKQIYSILGAGFSLPEYDREEFARISSIIEDKVK